MPDVLFARGGRMSNPFPVYDAPLSNNYSLDIWPAMSVDFSSQNTRPLNRSLSKNSCYVIWSMLIIKDAREILDGLHV